jgi:hypothetical protein
MSDICMKVCNVYCIRSRSDSYKCNVYVWSDVYFLRIGDSRISSGIFEVCNEFSESPHKEIRLIRHSILILPLRDHVNVCIRDYLSVT